MRLHRFITAFERMRQDEIRIEDEKVIHQMQKVLRLKKGDRAIVVTSPTHEAEVEIGVVTKKSMALHVLKEYEVATEPHRKIVLVCAILKKEHFEMVVQKATEVGVTEIVPLITEHTVKTRLNTVRMDDIAREAAEQSGRTIVPVIHHAHTWAELSEVYLKSITSPHHVYFFDTKQGVSTPAKNKEDVMTVVVIGPEGGWSDAERHDAHTQGMHFTSLGATTLRGETAAIIASYLAVHDTIQ